VEALGAAVFAAGLADRLAPSRPPALASEWPEQNLGGPEESARLVLCLAADLAEAREVFRKARLASRGGKAPPEEDRARAARVIAGAYVIRDVLANLLYVDAGTLDRFHQALKATVEGVLPAENRSGADALPDTAGRLPEAPEPPDGPEPPNRLRWRGQLVEGLSLSPTESRLLSLLLETGSVSFQEAEDHAWMKEDVNNKAIRQAVSALSKKLCLANVQGLTLSTKNSQVILSREPSEISER
jgi:hypothetical protein